MRKTVSRVCVFVSFLVVVASFLFIILHISSIDSIHATHLQPLHQQHWLAESSFTNCLYPPRYYKPSYIAVESYRNVKLVFFKKHKMSVVVNVARTKGWIVTGITKSFDKLVSDMNEDIFTIIFTSSKELSDLVFEQYTNSVNVLAAGIPGAYQFTGTKREQYLTYQRYLNKFGCSIESIKMMPALYLMDDSVQCQSFFDQLGRGVDHGKSTWVLKNSRGFGGDQVEIIHNTSALKARFGSCKSNGQFIVQEYIQNLLLVDKRKFDVRALVLIAGTQPYLLFYHDGYLRVVMKPFDPGASREVHLTNTHVQSLQPDFNPDKHFWSFEKFQSYLNENYPDNNDFVQTKLIPYIKRISLLILKSGMTIIGKRYYSIT